MAQATSNDELVTVYENGNSDQNRQREAVAGTTLPAAPTRPGQAVTHPTRGGVGVTTDPGLNKNGSIGVMWVGRQYAVKERADELSVIPASDLIAFLAR